MGNPDLAGHPIHMRLDYYLWLDASVPRQRDAIETGDYDTGVLRQILRLLGPASVSLDIGAGFGAYSCAMGTQLRDSSARIYAFEPNPVRARQLEANIQLNDLNNNVKLQHVALGKLSGQTKLTQDSPEVPVRRLDDWGAEYDIERCDFIRMATHGAEMDVFEGGRGFIEKHRPVIISEFPRDAMDWLGESGSNAINFFQPMRYIFFREFEDRFYPLAPKLNSEQDESPIHLMIPMERMRWAGFEWGMHEVS